MTTSDPQADRRDPDDGREHRSIGQRIRDAVLGEEPTDRRDDPDRAYADPDDARRGYRDADTAVDPDRGAADRAGRGATGGGAPAATNVVADRPTGYPDADTFDEAVHGAGSPASAHIASDRTVRGAGAPHPGTAAAGGYADPGAGSPAGAGRSDLVDPTDAAQPDDRAYDGPPSDDRAYDDRAYDDRASDGPAYGDRASDAVAGGDVVRDDTRSAGTAGTTAGTTAGATAAGLGTAGPGPVRDDADRGGTIRDHDRDDDHDRDYDPTADTGYVGERRAAVDATTGDRDADYDTGRVDTGRVDTGRIDPDDERPDLDAPERRSAGAGFGPGTGPGTGAVATHPAGDGYDDRSGTRGFGPGEGDFSAVDDTGTVDATSTGRATPAPGGSALAGTAASGADRDVAQRAEAVAADDAAEARGGRERLVPADRADDYSRRWDTLKGDFVDEPRRAVARADELVGEVLDDIQRLFTDQRRELEQGFDHDQASTEDLRLALRRYRSFFDRLLSL